MSTTEKEIEKAHDSLLIMFEQDAEQCRKAQETAEKEKNSEAYKIFKDELTYRVDQKYENKINVSDVVKDLQSKIEIDQDVCVFWTIDIAAADPIRFMNRFETLRFAHSRIGFGLNRWIRIRLAEMDEDRDADGLWDEAQCAVREWYTSQGAGDFSTFVESTIAFIADDDKEIVSLIEHLGERVPDMYDALSVEPRNHASSTP